MTRWKDTLPDVDEMATPRGGDLAAAVSWLARALEERSIASGVRGVTRDQVAAAFIRRHRKSLPRRTPRISDYGTDWADEQLLWTAVECVAATAAYVDDDIKSHHLREAEAVLRVLWRRQRVDGAS